jgi:hypothetical protein
LFTSWENRQPLPHVGAGKRPGEVWAEARPHPQARDAAARRCLRDLSDRLCGLVHVTDDAP